MNIDPDVIASLRHEASFLYARVPGAHLAALLADRDHWHRLATSTHEPHTPSSLVPVEPTTRGSRSEGGEPPEGVGSPPTT